MRAPASAPPIICSTHARTWAVLPEGERWITGPVEVVAELVLVWPLGAAERVQEGADGVLA